MHVEHTGAGANRQVPGLVAVAAVHRRGHRDRRYAAARHHGQHRRDRRASKIQDELNLSDAGRSWVITAYVLTFGGLMLLGGRLGDTIGRKRTFIVGVALFTIASILCGIAWDETTLVVAAAAGRGRRNRLADRLALVATTFPKGPARNAATAVFAAMTGVGLVMGLVIGGALTEVSWRWAFLVNVPIGW